jgi:hypothetical protein
MFSSLTRETYMRDAEPPSMLPVLSPGFARTWSTILDTKNAGDDLGSLHTKATTSAAGARRESVALARTFPGEVAENNYLTLHVDV